MFEQTRHRVRVKIKEWLFPSKPQLPALRDPWGDFQKYSRMYAAAKASRLTTGWGNLTSSEDHELLNSLTRLRNRSRELCRDAGYAKRAKVVVQNNVVGSGIGLQGKVLTSRGSLNRRINDDIEEAWDRWTEAPNCHMGGELHFEDLERQVMGQIFETGEVFLRIYRVRVGTSRIPLALDIIEAERLSDEFRLQNIAPGAVVRLGIETDRFHRPLAYHMRTIHPGDFGLDTVNPVEVERVPASDILHPRIIDRWPMTRGVPWLHAAARRLNDIDGLSEAEITAARAAACYMGIITQENPEAKFGEKQSDGTMLHELEPAIVARLRKGEKWEFAAPNRPNSQLDPFMRLMLREVAAAGGTSYESLSRDYSQSNYSSSRLALLDDRDLWRTLQKWFIRSVRMPLHRIWLTAAVLAGAVRTIPLEAYGTEPEFFQSVRFKPRGWNWIDPTKEVDAFKEAIRAGFTTVSRVIEQTGNGDDLEDILEERERELLMFEEYGVPSDLNPSAPTTSAASANQPAPQATEPDNEPDEGNEPDEADRRRRLYAVRGQRRRTR